MLQSSVTSLVFELILVHLPCPYEFFLRLPRLLSIATIVMLSIKVTILSSSRVHPDSFESPLGNRPPPPDSKAFDVPLSILDSTYATFAPAAAVWFFSGNGRSPSTLLCQSLAKALSAYPHFAGSLWLTPHPSNGERASHTERFRRCHITYGNDLEFPGVQWTVANTTTELDELVPLPSQRTSTHRVWDLTGPSLDEFLPKEKLALQDIDGDTGDPCLAVQVTSFSYHGLAVGVKAAHAVADAETLIQFVKSVRIHSVPQSITPG